MGSVRKVSGHSLSAAMTLLGMSLGMAACRHDPPRSEVVGDYELHGMARGGISLSLQEDGHFVEKIREASGKTDVETGTWKFRRAHVTLIGFWMPKELLRSEVLQENAKDAATAKRLDGPSTWDLEPEIRFNEIVLPVFRDDRVEFWMTEKS